MADFPPVPDQRQVDAFWAAFQAATGHDGAPAAVYPFGDSVELAEELLALILAGRKQATADLAMFYDVEGETVPKPGDHAIVLDGAGRPCCVIRTTDVDIVPYGDVTAEFAAAEGEGDLSLDYWRQAHWDYYTRWLEPRGLTMRQDYLIVCERFVLIWAAAAPPG